MANSGTKEMEDMSVEDVYDLIKTNFEEAVAAKFEGKSNFDNGGKVTVLRKNTPLIIFFVKQNKK